jgi:integrase
MTRVKLSYYVVRKGRGYFELGKARAEASGLPASEPLGLDGPEAWARAKRCYEAYKAACDPSGSRRLGGYPPGSLGAAYVLWRGSADWSDKAQRTREEYQRAWDDHIDQAFGKKLLTAITVADSEAFHRRMKKELSASDAHRTLKIWRAILNMLEKKHLIARAPIGAVSNPLPTGRSQYWLADEIDQLVKHAEETGRETLSLMIRLAWETALSPVDCRTLSLSMIRKDRAGHHIERQRTKTGAAAQPPISDDLARDLLAYADRLPVQLMPSQPLFRNPQGRAYTKTYMAHEFAALRRLAFGGDERRQFLDIRRSANLEADLGGASAEDRAEVLANALHKNRALDATYTPPTVARARKTQEARKAGRALLKQEAKRAQSRNSPAGKV